MKISPRNMISAVLYSALQLLYLESTIKSLVYANIFEVIQVLDIHVFELYIHL